MKINIFGSGVKKCRYEMCSNKQKANSDYCSEKCNLKHKNVIEFMEYVEQFNQLGDNSITKGYLNGKDPEQSEIVFNRYSFQNSINFKILPTVSINDNNLPLFIWIKSTPVTNSDYELYCSLKDVFNIAIINNSSILRVFFNISIKFIIIENEDEVTKQLTIQKYIIGDTSLDLGGCVKVRTQNELLYEIYKYYALDSSSSKNNFNSEFNQPNKIINKINKINK